MKKNKKLFSEVPLDGVNNDINYIFEHKDIYKSSQKIQFNCEDCGKISTISVSRIKKPFLCGYCRNKQKFLEKYGVENPFQLKEIKEKIKQTCLEKYGVENPSQSKEIRERIKETYLERYGVENATQSEIVKEKARQTCLERYGVVNAAMSKAVKQHIKDTCLEKYGKEYYSQTEEFKQKSKQTCLEKYGVENPSQVKEIRDKANQTNIERYGSHNAFQSDIIKRRIKNSLLEKYGVEYITQVPEIKNKIKRTCLNKYGVEYSLQSKEIRNKSKQTCLERYGAEFYTQTEEYSKRANKKFIYNNIKFDSSWELYFWIWATENGHNIKREPIKLEYTFNNEQHFYFPDFELDGQLIEIKGPQFFSKEGKMISPRDRSLDNLFEAKHQCGLKHNVKFIKDISEAKEYVDSKYTSSFVKLFNSKLEFPYPNVNLTNINDAGLVRYFHKSIWDAKVGLHASPIEAWQDKNLVYKVALNRLKYKGQCTPSHIIDGFSVTRYAPKVSVFKPNLAKRIIKMYASEYTTVFDPFSGFSGRMLGAIRNGKNYIGQDLSEVHIEESKALLEWVKENQGLDVEVDLKCQNILTDTEKVFKNTCLFTCSPYGSKETWTEGEVQMSCDEWIEVCLNKYKCDKYIFVVDETDKYKDYIVETIENRSHFGTNNEYILVI